MKEIKSLNALRGIWAILIYLHHFLYYYPEEGVKSNLALGDRGVLFFFILSGFLLSIKYFSKEGFNENTHDFVIKRLSNIFPIQWLILVVCLIFSYNIVSWWAVPFHFTLTQSLIPLWQINFTLYFPSWFLSTILFCYIAFPFIINFFSKNIKVASVIYIVLLLAYCVAVIALPSSIGRRWITYINPFARLLDFTFGIILGIIFKLNYRLINNLKPGICTVLEIIAISASVLCICKSPNHFVPIVWLYPILGTLIFIFAVNNGAISKLLSKDPVSNFFGNNSLCIYMTHVIILIPIVNSIHLTCVPEFLIILLAISIISWALQKYYIPWASNLFVKVAKKVLLLRKN